MLSFSPQLFSTILTGALRLGREGYQMYLNDILDDQDIRAFIPLSSPSTFDDPTSEVSPEIESWVIQQVSFNEEYLPGARYEGIFETHEGAPATPVLGTNGLPKLAQSNLQMFEDALQEKALENQRRHDPTVRAKDVRKSLVTFHTKAWTDENDPSPWGMFFRNMLDVGFDILAVQPGLLGIGGNVEAFISALMPNLAATYSAEPDADHGVLRELAETFGEAALKSLADNPSLVTDEARWEPLISGILGPVHDDVTKHGVNQLFAERRLRELLSGPVAFGAISAISENADDFLKGDAHANSIPGAIVRETLGVIASGTPEGFNVRHFFTDEAAMNFMAAALKTAKTRPELFIRDGRLTDEGTSHGRNLLTLFAETFLSAPMPFRADKTLAIDLATKSLDVMTQYAEARLISHAGDDAHRQARADMAAHVVSDLLTGFKRRLTGEKENLLSTVFSRPQLLDMMQIMASHVVRSPHHFISDDANPQVVAIAEAIAQAIAEDEIGLLNGEDWTKVINIALDVALKNPGRLFSLESSNPEDSIALALIRNILRTAQNGMQIASDRPFLLFGETLSSAIRISLTAAASGALSLLKDPDQLEAHMNEVTHLANRLNALAASPDPKNAISADDWLSIYAFFIAHVIENGPGTMDQLSDSDLLQALADGAISMNSETHS